MERTETIWLSRSSRGAFPVSRERSSADRKSAGVGKLSLWTTLLAVYVFFTLSATALPAQTFTTLATFNGSDGIGPLAPLTQGTDGNFYGTTAEGGNISCYGTTYEGGLYSFTGASDGGYPFAGLV